MEATYYEDEIICAEEINSYLSREVFRDAEGSERDYYSDVSALKGKIQDMGFNLNIKRDEAWTVFVVSLSLYDVEWARETRYHLENALSRALIEAYCLSSGEPHPF
jgi:hypothetical protein